jgi:hypothetical protein
VQRRELEQSRRQLALCARAKRTALLHRLRKSPLARRATGYKSSALPRDPFNVARGKRVCLASRSSARDRDAKASVRFNP